MFEAKITIDAPEIATALNNLAQAINNLTTKQPQNVEPASYNAPAEVAQTPVAPVAEAAKATQPEVVAQAKPEKTYTADDLSRAGAALIDQGKMPQLIEILKKHGVQAITQLKPEQYGAVATELNAIGANL